MYSSFQEVPGVFKFATAKNSNDLEEIQKFLDDAINDRSADAHLSFDILEKWHELLIVLSFMNDLSLCNIPCAIRCPCLRGLSFSHRVRCEGTMCCIFC